MWNFYRKQEECGGEQCSENHWVFQHGNGDVREGGLSPAKDFQNDHREDVVKGNDERNHHRWDGERFFPENTSDQRNAHEHEGAAEGILQNCTATLVGFFQGADERRGKDKGCDDCEKAKENESRANGGGEVCSVHVVEHHAEEKHVEHHAVHVRYFRFREPTLPLDENADGDEDENRKDGACGDKEMIQKMRWQENHPPLFF